MILLDETESERDLLLDINGYYSEDIESFQDEMDTEDVLCVCNGYYNWINTKCRTATKLILIEWIVLGILSVIYYIVFLIQHSNDTTSKSINVGYILCCLLPVLLFILAMLQMKYILSIHSICQQIVDSYTLYGYKIIEFQKHGLHICLQKLRQIKMEKYGMNLALKHQLKMYREGTFRFMDNRVEPTMSSKQMKLVRKRANSDEINRVKTELIKLIKRKRLEIEKREKSLLKNRIYNIILSKKSRYKKVIDIYHFHSLIDLWPYRYKQRFKDSGKTWRDFTDVSFEIIDEIKLWRFIDKMVAKEVRNGMRISGLNIPIDYRLLNQNITKIPHKPSRKSGKFSPTLGLIVE